MWFVDSIPTARAVGYFLSPLPGLRKERYMGKMPMIQEKKPPRSNVGAKAKFKVDVMDKHGRTRIKDTAGNAGD